MSVHISKPVSNFAMEGDLLDQLQAAGLGAASPLYTKFADGIRSLLRHKLEGADPEEGVGTVLETVAVAIRERRIRTLDQLPSQIRAAVNSYVHQARAAGAPPRACVFERIAPNPHGPFSRSARNSFPPLCPKSDGRAD